jgi:hypothetical protein
MQFMFRWLMYVIHFTILGILCAGQCLVECTDDTTAGVPNWGTSVNVNAFLTKNGWSTVAGQNSLAANPPPNPTTTGGVSLLELNFHSQCFMIYQFTFQNAS